MHGVLLHFPEAAVAVEDGSAVLELPIGANLDASAPGIFLAVEEWGIA